MNRASGAFIAFTEDNEENKGGGHLGFLSFPSVKIWILVN